ncbi:MAG: uridine kinase [Robiginitomaculum sp.]|nr:MAG: uridine kinase [Robiginitomaculum sp.]
MDVHIIAIAGGSCSGKTRLADHTHKALNEDVLIDAAFKDAVLADKVCTIVRQDNYYLDYGGANPGDPLPNFDHPNAFEWDLLRDQLLALKSGKPVDIPTYDFVTHRRAEPVLRVEPRPIILIEGILLLSQPELLSVYDKIFFVKCSEDVRLDRRLKRDVIERGRTPESIRTQFAKDVAPMQAEFVDPSQEHADVIITQDMCGLDVIMNSGPLISYCRSLL